MAGNTFIRFYQPNASSPIIGESQAELFPGSKGWIEIGDWSWDIESETNIAKGSGASLGKPTSGNFSFSHAYDVSAPPMMINIVQGTSFAKAQLVMLKQTGSGGPKVYFAMNMTNVYMTKVGSKGGEDGVVSQDIEMVFTQLDVGYLKQLPDGTLDSSQISFSWDIVKQNTTTVMANVVSALAAG